MRTNYRIDDFQETYFVLRSSENLLELSSIDFAPFYERLNQGPHHTPAMVLSSDKALYLRI
jgi:phenylalanine-4-hydroxylase